MGPQSQITTPTPPSTDQKGPSKYITNLSRLPANVKLALLFLFIAGDIIVLGLPRLLRHPVQPSFWLFLLTGLLVIASLGIFFKYLSRLNLGLANSTLVLTFGYAATIAIIKLILSPLALYNSNAHAEFSYSGSNPNSVEYYLATAFVIMVLYLVVFRIVYGHFLNRLSGDKHKRITKKGILKLLVAIGAIVLTGGAVVLIPLLFFYDQFAYLQYVFSTFGIPVILAVVLAIYMAYRSFADVEKQVAATGNATLLASAYWIGVSLIIVFHVMWVIFMITLVTIWPFKTVYSK